MTSSFNSDSGFIKETDWSINNEFTDRTLISESKTGFTLLYKAKRMGKWYVLKSLKPEYASDSLYQNLLMKEFEIGFHLAHPHITQTIGIEEVDKLGKCIVLEYIDGVSLREWIEKNHNPSPTSEKIAQEIIDALSYIHNKQIIHRDLKPENILITHNGLSVKLIDFGLSDSDNYAILKQPAGSIPYAAPELSDKEIILDNRADIYALGHILIEMGFAKAGKKCIHPDREKRPRHAKEVLPLLKKKPFISRAWLFIVPFLLVVGISTLIWLNQDKEKVFEGTAEETEERIDIPAETPAEIEEEATERAIEIATEVPAKRQEELPVVKEKATTSQPPATKPSQTITQPDPPIQKPTIGPSADSFLGVEYTLPKLKMGKSIQKNSDICWFILKAITARLEESIQEIESFSSVSQWEEFIIQSRGNSELRHVWRDEVMPKWDVSDYTEAEKEEYKPVFFALFEDFYYYESNKQRPRLDRFVKELYQMDGLIDEALWAETQCKGEDIAHHHVEEFKLYCDNISSSITEMGDAYNDIWKKDALRDAEEWLNGQISSTDPTYRHYRNFMIRLIDREENASKEVLEKKKERAFNRFTNHHYSRGNEVEAVETSTGEYKIRVYDPKTVELLKKRY